MGGGAATTEENEYVSPTLRIPPGPPTLNEWNALSTEQPMEPIADLPILDCHHHFFDIAHCYAGDAVIDKPDAAKAMLHTALGTFLASRGAN